MCQQGKNPHESGGDVQLHRNEGGNMNITLSNVALSPECAANIMSVSKLTAAGAEVLFNKKKAIVTKHGECIMEGIRQRGYMYMIKHC